MEIEISENTTRRIAEISQTLGIQKKDLIRRAILVYLDAISKDVQLREEMQELDNLSDEALYNFEKSL
ncbi:MAG: hypothetical protein AABY00_03650 [Nanoarchaeota archaeon]